MPASAQAADAAARRHDGLAKPQGSLGRLERLGVRLAAMAGSAVPPVPEPVAAVLFAADHGVVAAGVTPWPQSVTALMVRTIVGGRAASNALARQVGAELVVVDVGVADPLTDLDGHPGLVRAKVAPGSADLANGPALTPAEVEAALDTGAGLALGQVDAGRRALVAGEMGIGNTTASAAVIAALTGRPAGEVTGRGTGVDDVTLVHKAAVVDRAVRRLPPGAGARAVLAEVGGLEIAALAGLLVGAASRRVPVVLDGVVTLAAALAAAELAPAAVDYWIAGHRPVEPGGRAVLEHLDLEPVLDLELRLGEGTGALLAVPIIQAAARVLGEVATLDEVLGDRDR